MRGLLNNRMVSVLGSILLLCSLSACGPTLPTYQKKRERFYYSYAVRQLPPQPVYNRLRYAHLPEPLPQRKIVTRSAPRVLPIFEYEVEDLTLDEAALILATAMRYDSYTAPSISERKVSLVALGTIDELAQQLADNSKSYVYVDHTNRQIRFLAQRGIAPALEKKKVSKQ